MSDTQYLDELIHRRVDRDNGFVTKIRGNTVTISGYVNIIGNKSNPLWSQEKQHYFQEIIMRGAFKNAVSRAGINNIGVYIDHKRPLAAYKILSLREDDKGLYARVSCSDPDIIAAAREKRLKGWSFGFTAVKDRWKEVNEMVNNTPVKLIRYLDEMQLQEISIIVNYKPCYPNTTIHSSNV